MNSIFHSVLHFPLTPFLFKNFFSICSQCHFFFCFCSLQVTMKHMWLNTNVIRRKTRFVWGSTLELFRAIPNDIFFFLFSDDIFRRYSVFKLSFSSLSNLIYSPNLSLLLVDDVKNAGEAMLVTKSSASSWSSVAANTWKTRVLERNCFRIAMLVR